MENKLNLPQKKKKNEAESPRLDPLMRALKALLDPDMVFRFGQAITPA